MRRCLQPQQGKDKRRNSFLCTDGVFIYSAFAKYMAKKKGNYETLGEFAEALNAVRRKSGLPEATPREDPPTHEVNVHFINRPKS